MEDLALYTGAPTLHWEDNASSISVIEDKIFTQKVKHIHITVYLYKKNLKIVSLFQNMRSIVSCRQICAPNHVQIQL